MRTIFRVRRPLGLMGATAAVAWLAAVAARAHFQVLLPSAEVVTAGGSRDLHLDLRFTHPMACGPVMEMGPPVRFGVLVKGRVTDLRSQLQEVRIDGKTAYTCDYRVASPGDHIFFLEPAPYWEPAEGKMIVHYTKVVVNAFGEEEGWDASVGFPVEVQPLSRPYGLWAGNLFRGVVLRQGKPVPFAEVEVEYWNEDSRIRAPSDPYVTQVIKADAQGVFAYAMPRAGWWGFAALVDGDEPLRNPDGVPADVELGALLWVRCAAMK
ncbi:MAG: DUF4198 domain-containing protein [Lentisphaeria bacterium]|nr:DUF4198 domain-containing protein [Lentisphaeria bacterium]